MFSLPAIFLNDFIEFREIVRAILIVLRRKEHTEFQSALGTRPGETAPEQRIRIRFEYFLQLLVRNHFVKRNRAKRHCASFRAQPISFLASNTRLPFISPTS